MKKRYSSGSSHFKSIICLPDTTTRGLGVFPATTGWNGRTLLPYKSMGANSIQNSVGINVFQACIGVMTLEMQFGASLKVTYTCLIRHIVACRVSRSLFSPSPRLTCSS
ncbi:hypothetical protein XPA_002711 [Xanthoria parietina]